MIINYIIGFIATITTEAIVAKKFFDEKYIVTVIILMNLISHPILNTSLFILKYNMGWQINWLQIMFFEVCVILLEILLLIFVGINKLKSIKLSIYCNTASLLVGYVMLKLKLFLYV